MAIERLELQVSLPASLHGASVCAPHMSAIADHAPRPAHPTMHTCYLVRNTMNMQIAFLLVQPRRLHGRRCFATKRGSYNETRCVRFK